MRTASGRMKMLDIPSSTVGAIAELAVACFLLKKGYEVYRPLSPSCSGDLLIEKNSKFIKIEVRSGYRHLITGKVYFSIKNVRAETMAVVIQRTEEILFFKYPSKEVFEFK